VLARRTQALSRVRAGKQSRKAGRRKFRSKFSARETTVRRVYLTSEEGAIDDAADGASVVQVSSSRTIFLKALNLQRAGRSQRLAASQLSGHRISTGQPVSSNRPLRRLRHRVPSRPSGSGVRPGIDGCAGCAMPEHGRLHRESGSPPLPPAH
jgi:hypothetical protein